MNVNKIIMVNIQGYGVQGYGVVVTMKFWDKVKWIAFFYL
jgi:hypothetical protein